MSIKYDMFGDIVEETKDEINIKKLVRIYL